jgi:putative thiamine transport system permease protein
MAAPHRALSRLRLAPPLTVLALGLPIVAGVAGTLLPAFGLLPAIGQSGFSLQAWAMLFDTPGFGTSLRLTLTSGIVATAVSLVLAMAVLGCVHHRAWAARLGAAMAPLLATPHAALAIGLAFVLAPSGWLVRWVSPGLTGWAVPPDVSTVGHPSGWALVLGLVVKEVPYLILMSLGALHQVAAAGQAAAARALGYAPALVWFKLLLPQVMAQIRLPLVAVLAFSLSVVDMALILGPGNPPTLAVLAVRWATDPDLSRLAPAAAAALAVSGLVLAALLAAWALERLLARWGLRWVESGDRGRIGTLLAGLGAAASACLAALAGLSMVALVLWSLAWQWRYPQAWPQSWTLTHWSRQLQDAAMPALNTIVVGTLATGLALALTLACLEHEARAARVGVHPTRGIRSARAPWLMYLPLLVPQVTFLLGIQILLVRVGLDATVLAVVACHLVFVLPYLLLSLADPWRALDARYARAAASLGASADRVFWRIKLPILRRPVLIACAVGFSVSVAQYLPTLMAGSGRVPTLTTEAVTLASGDDRRVVAVWALLQTLLPLAAFAIAAARPGRRAWPSAASS